MQDKILIVDDNVINRELLRGILSAEYIILEAGDGVEAMDVLHREAQPVAAILLDLMMPRMDGYQVMEQLQASQALSRIPVIVTTGSTDSQAEIKALNCGATEFITKPYSPEIIRRRLKNLIHLQESAAMLNSMQRDQLTGLYNRETFFSIAEKMIEAMPEGYYVLASMDIDNFKVVNDQYGTEKGDQVLRYVAAQVRQEAAAEGTLCGRISEDNFVLLYPRSLKRFDGLEWQRGGSLLPEGLPMPITVSTGCYIVEDKSLSVSAMYDRASLAQVTVKGRYDVHVAVYDESMRSHLLREQEIVNEMNTALETGQFEAWFQPLYNHSTGALIGAEALTRWRHPRYGLVVPGAFIPIFERNGFVYELDKYIWEQVCICLRRWTDEGRDPLPVSVNLSRYDLFCGDLVDVLRGLVEKYDIPVELLRLEITESAFSQSTEQVVEVAKKLIACGFTMEIDDFGSGYSSLNTLKDVPAHILKLDMRFLEGEGHFHRGGTILESIARMAKWLGMAVIAEGVETSEQADFLKSIGCSYVQGYFYGRPMPAEEYEALARAAVKEEKLLSMETVENLDSNSFWNPKSMDTLIFNTYVGGACIFEWHDNRVELLRANEKYARMMGGEGCTVEDVMNLVWEEHMDPAFAGTVKETLEHAMETGDDAVCEIMYRDLFGRNGETWVRTTFRAIARTSDRCIFYSTGENITAQREADRQLRFLNDLARDLLAQPEIEDCIDHALHKIQEHFDADRAYIIEQDDSRSICNNTYEVCSPGVSSGMAELQEVPYAACSLRLAAHEAGGYVYIKDLTDLPLSGREERELLKARGVRSLIAVSLHRDGRQIGFIGLDNPKRRQAHMEQLQALSDYLTVMLTRRDLTAKIENDRKLMQKLMEDTPGGFAQMRLLPGGESFTVYVNDSFCRLLGTTAERVYSKYGKNPLEAIHPDDRELVRQGVINILETGEDQNLKYRLLCRDGSYVPFNVFWRGTKNEDGSLLINGYYADMSAQEKRDLSMRNLIPFVLSAIMESSTDLAFAKDKEFRYLCCSQPFARMAGLSSPEEVVGKTDYDLFDKELADHYRSDDLRLIQGGKSLIDYVESAPSEDGLRRYVNTSKYILRDSAGEVVGLYGSGRDVTDERAANRRLQLFLESPLCAIATFEFGPDSMRTLYSSDGFFSYSGYTREEYLENTRKDPLYMILEEDRPELRRAVEATRLEGTPLECRFRCRTKDGGFRWFHLRGVATDRFDDKVIVMAVQFDVTGQQREAESQAALERERLYTAIQDLSSMAVSVNLSQNYYRLLFCDGLITKAVPGRGEYDRLVSDNAAAVSHHARPQYIEAFSRDRLLAAFAAGEKKVELDHRQMGSDGVMRWVRTQVLRVKNPYSDDVLQITLVRSIDEQMAYQALLQKTYDLTIENMPNFVAKWLFKDGDVLLLDANAKYLEFMGITAEEAFGKSIIYGFSEEEKDQVISMLYEFEEERRSISFTSRACKANGEECWLRVQASFFEKQDGCSVYYGTLTEVTELVETREALRISQEEYKVAAALSERSVLRYDLRSHKLSVLSQGEEELDFAAVDGQAPEVLIEKFRLVPESAGPYRRLFEAIRQGVSGEKLLLTCDGPAGEKRWAEWEYEIIRDRDGNPATAILSIEDVTKRINARDIFKIKSMFLDTSENVKKLMVLNLTAGELEYESHGPHGQLGKRTGTKDYESTKNFTLLNYVYEDDVRACGEFFDRKRLLSGFEKGDREETFEYRGLDEAGRVRWMRARTNTVRDEGSGDVKTYVVFSDIDEEKKAFLNIRKQAELDPLTGVLNRAAFAARAGETPGGLSASSRCALLMLDVDGFKQINDTFGHAVGDQVLAGITDALRPVLRSGDLLGRFGGDEFLILLKDMESDTDIENKARYINDLLRREYGGKVQATVSIGIAVCPRDGSDFDTVLRKADAALYFVKNTGKDDVRFYEPGMEK
ncbi:MAG: EAL domain-containing protein [Bacillota bacterium]|nr:EAL domain-containing protein [Bacillota bacterium]